MGTHGRVAITRDGVHRCHEQSMDGHDAAMSVIEEIVREGGPQMTWPSMGDGTNECDHGANFGHIDYDRKIIYSGMSDPTILTEDNIEVTETDWQWPDALEYAMTVTEGVRRLHAEGWRFVWSTAKCPQEYLQTIEHYDEEQGEVVETQPCVNSLPASIQDFLNDTAHFRWIAFCPPGERMNAWDGMLLCPPLEGPHAVASFSIADPLPARIELYTNGWGQIYAQYQERILVGRHPRRNDRTIRQAERLAATGDPIAQQHLDEIAPPIWRITAHRIMPVHYFVAQQIAAGYLSCEELRQIAAGQNEERFKLLIREWMLTIRTQS